MKRKYISIFIFIIGLSIFLYPRVARVINLWEDKKIIEEYNESIEDLSEELEMELVEEYEHYNEILSDEVDVSDGNSLKRVIGTVEIPKLKLQIPIYQGATIENLRMGVGQISGTSLPVGEIGTHSVLAGHNGYSKKELFTNINKLKNGDTFKVYSLGKEMEYEVVNTIVVDPYETDYFNIEEDKDKVTLLTCSDFGTRRLLVMGERKK